MAPHGRHYPRLIFVQDGCSLTPPPRRWSLLRVRICTRWPPTPRRQCLKLRFVQDGGGPSISLYLPASQLPCIEYKVCQKENQNFQMNVIWILCHVTFLLRTHSHTRHTKALKQQKRLLTWTISGKMQKKDYLENNLLLAIAFMIRKYNLKFTLKKNAKLKSYFLIKKFVKRCFTESQFYRLF